MDALIEANAPAEHVRSPDELLARMDRAADMAMHAYVSSAKPETLAHLRKMIDAKMPSPAGHVGGGEQRGVGIGMAIAAGIIMRSWGQETYAREILGAAGLDTLEKLKASGVDQYDIDALKSVVSASEVEG